MGEHQKPSGDDDKRRPVSKSVERGQEKDEVALAGEDSFPASDPPSFGPVTHPGRP